MKGMQTKANHILILHCICSYYGGTKPKLAVACGAVRRVHSQPVYRSKDYEVCLTREGYSEPYRLLSRRVSNDEQPSAAALDHFKDHTQLKGQIFIIDSRDFFAPSIIYVFEVVSCLQ